jgi:two-component system sensor histidine kinase FlrB
MAAQAQQTLTFTGFEQNASITGNLTALQGAVLNLIHNASQVTPKGECVHIKASVSEHRLHVSIIDKGPGVPDSLKNKIFEPFFTTKTHGTGLGLAVVKSVVSAHSGVLNVIDVPEGGTCFSLSLPCSANAKSPQTLTHVA